MNKLFPIVLALLFFSCTEDEESSYQLKEGWNKSNMLDEIKKCTITPCDNDYITCSDLQLMCKCDVEAIAHSFSYSRWQKLSSSKDESILTASDLKALEKKFLYQKECYYDNNLTSDFILGVLASIEQALEGLKKDYNE